MSINVFVVSKENSETYIDRIVLWYHANAPENCKDYYIGSIIISDYFTTTENIKNNKLENFSKLLNRPPEAIYGKDQLNELLKEIIIAEKLGLISTKDFNIIKIGINIALEKELYLRFW